MQTEDEKTYLIKAINAFKRRLIVISPDFSILAANQQTNGVVEKTIVGQKCYHVFYNRPSPCENCSASEVLQTRESVLKAKSQCEAELGMLPCLYSYPIFSGKQIDALVSMDFDLPTQTGLEEKLDRTNAFLRNLILSAVNGVIAADKKGKLLIFNDAASEITGYSIEEALNQVDIRNIYSGNGAYDVMAKLRSEEHGGVGKLKSYQIEVLRKNGETIPISLNASIVYDGDRELATIGFFHDLRDELRMKEELEKTRVQLLQAEKMASLGKLAAGVAHQLNNPLGGIILFAKLIMEEYELEGGIQEDLKRILKDAERCRDTVRELLEFARQTRQFMRPYDINDAISRTLFLLENQPLFQNIDIEKDLAASLPLLQVDIQQLNHVFMNIILNAAEAMRGSGKLAVMTYQLPEGNRVRIEISDTGPGIPDDVLPHIFEPFFTTKEEGKGTGLGLSLVYGIVENHSGTIIARNNPDGGTTFIIEIPLHKQEDGDNQSGQST